MTHKRVFIIHGWGGNPNEAPLVWLKQQLEAANFDVSVPAMPDTDHPTIEAWVSKIGECVGTSDAQTYFVGHSIGAQAVLRYIESLPKEQEVGGAVLVAGWLHLTDEVWDEDYTKEIAAPWLETPIDFDTIKTHTTNLVAVQSDNDPYVPFSDGKAFEKLLGAKLIVAHKAGHINEEEGITTLPDVLEALVTFAKN